MRPTYRGPHLKMRPTYEDAERLTANLQRHELLGSLRRDFDQVLARRNRPEAEVDLMGSPRGRGGDRYVGHLLSVSIQQRRRRRDAVRVHVKADEKTVGPREVA